MYAMFVIFVMCDFSVSRNINEEMGAEPLQELLSSLWASWATGLLVSLFPASQFLVSCFHGRFVSWSLGLLVLLWVQGAGEDLQPHWFNHKQPFC